MEHGKSEHLSMCVAMMQALVESGATLSRQDMLKVSEILASSFSAEVSPLVQYDTYDNLAVWIDEVQQVTATIEMTFAEVECIEDDLASKEPPLNLSPLIGVGGAVEWRERST